MQIGCGSPNSLGGLNFKTCGENITAYLMNGVDPIHVALVLGPLSASHVLHMRI
jgi:hypothetical protein